MPKIQGFLAPGANARRLRPDLGVNARNSRTLAINNRHINETTIEAFVEKALNNQKNCYKFIAHKFYNRKRV
jgi:hypothetical protein